MPRMTPEAERLKYLGSLAILDTPPDPGFDRIAEIARHAFDVPLAAVSFVDADRQWFKAQRGLPFAETPRDTAICNHTIRSDSVFVVEDAGADPRFAGNPLVAGPPHVRFYAGAPLAVEPGVRLGALCVMADRPRGLGIEEQQLLQLLAEDVCDRIRRHASQIDSDGEFGRDRERMLLELSRELARRDQVSRQVYRIARIGGWKLDLMTDALDWSDEVYALLDVGRDFPLEFHAAVDLVLEEYRQTAIDAIRTAAETGGSFEIEVPIHTKAGPVRWMRVLGEMDLNNGGTHLIGTVQDVTADREIEAALKRVATTDSLTGLSNRASFMTEVEAVLQEASSAHPAALLLLDLDGFKDINDMLGHDAGDRLLTVMSGRLKSCLRGGDVIGRLGGDEFGVLLRDRSVIDSAVMARLVLEAATAPIPYQGHSMHVGASVGIALFPNDAPDATALMKRADVALYSVKRAGGEGFQFYSRERALEAESRATLLREVRAGLNAGEFTIAYQPVVNLRERTIAGVEALIRWKHPQRGLLPASEFLAALEEPNLGRLLSDTARRIAVEQFALWNRQGLSLGRLGLNVSVGQLREVEFAERLFESLTEHGLSPTQIVLEITEGVLLGRGSENVARRIGTLHDHGVRIALDDFGTGYASLTHLRQFPVDILKIDASFVRAMVSAEANRTIVKTVIDMAHGLGMRAVAEGVESPEIDAVLKLMGCDLGQGYFYGRPALAQDLPRQLSTPADRIRAASNG